MICLSALTQVIATGGPAAAVTCTKTWQVGVTGNWDDPASWHGNQVPQPGDHVCLHQGDTVTVRTAVTVVSIGMLFTGTGGSLTVTSNGAITLTGQPFTGGGSDANALWIPLVNNGVVTIKGDTHPDSSTWTLYEGGHGAGVFRGTSGGRLQFGNNTLYTLDDGAVLAGGVGIGYHLPVGCVPATTCAHPDPGKVSVAAGATAVARGVGNFLVTGYLNGPGTFRVVGTLHWQSDPNPAGAATQGGGGVLKVEPGGTLLIDGTFGHSGGTFGCGAYGCGGVNLRGGRTIDNEGMIILSKAGFIAADDGTHFINRPASGPTPGALGTLAPPPPGGHPPGTVVIRNDRGYFAGTSIAGKGPSTFLNQGFVAKSQGSGVSVVDAAYSGSGAVIATSGEARVFGLAVNGKIQPTRTVATGSTQNGQTSPNGVSLTAKRYATAVTNRGSAKRELSIAELPASSHPQPGFTRLSDRVRASRVVTRPGDTLGSASASVDLELDQSTVVGTSLDELAVFNRGGLLPDCVSTSPPKPSTCLVRPSGPDADGDVHLTVLSSVVTSADALSRDACCRLEALKSPPPKTVTLGAGGFSPTPADVPGSGTVVTWSFDGNHSVRDALGLGDSGPLFDSTQQPGSSFSYTFMASGTYPVRDACGQAKCKSTVRVHLTKTRVDARHSTIWWAASSNIPRCGGCVFDLKTAFVAPGTAGRGRETVASYSSTHRTFALRRGTYHWWARLRNPGRGMSGWSPEMSLRVT